MIPLRLMYVTDPATCERDVVDVALAAEEGGADAVQVRGVEGDRELFDLAARLVSALQPSTRVLVNERFDVALAAGASGVHLKDGSLEPAAVREAASRAGAPPSFRIGVSTHDAGGLVRAAAQSASHVTLGPLNAAHGSPGRGAESLGRLLAEAATTGGIPGNILLLGGAGAGDAAAARALARPGVAVGLAAIRFFQEPESLRDVTKRTASLVAALG